MAGDEHGSEAVGHRGATAGELLERIFATTELMIAYLDRDLRFVRVNRAYAAADGAAPEAFVGKGHFELYPNAENEAIFRRVLATGLPHVAHAKPFVYARNPERGTTYWDWTVQPVQEAGGAPDGLLLTLADVTERERAAIALRESESRHRDLVSELQATLANVRTLRGLLPICASCKGIRDDHGYWSKVEQYLSEHADVRFTHGLCPECYARLYPDLGE